MRDRTSWARQKIKILNVGNVLITPNLKGSKITDMRIQDTKITDTIPLKHKTNGETHVVDNET